ncbi:MAG: C25 family cysteine peptidase [Candidatus Thermoplasmatota archaeon]
MIKRNIIFNRQIRQIIVTMLCLVIITTSSVAIDINTKKNDQIITPIEITINNLDFIYEKISTSGNIVYASIEIRNEGTTTDIGKAKLPIIRKLIEIPYDAEPDIIVKSISWKTTSLTELNLPEQIIPIQPSTQKNKEKTTDLIIDENYYSTNTYTPKDTPTISIIGYIRSHRIAQVEIPGVVYNPTTGELKLLDACELQINLNRGNTEKTIENNKRYASSSFEQLIKSMIINYNSYNTGNSDGKNIEGYLIIVHDNFYNQILPLAEWKQNKGYEVTITKTSQIPGGATKENIKNYIVNAYNNWPNPPSYILLVGDTAQIPTWTGTATGTCTDLYYVTITQPDYFPDIFIGRFPATQSSHVTAMVDKTIYYERGEFPSNSWIKKAAFMASEDNYLISEGTHNYVISTYLNPNGYTCDKLYCHTYGATTQQVKNALNNGRNLAIYSGHGSTTSWADGPAFSQSDVNSLTNQNMYPFVCSHACLTNQFTVSECFGETWLRTSNKGGLAFWGASDYTYWEEDDILEKKMFYAWWTDNLKTIGGMTNRALYYLYQYYGGAGLSKYYFEAYNVLGDSSVKIWQDNPIPNPPTTPSGPTKGIGDQGVQYQYTTSSTAGNNLYFKFLWGDGSDSGWMGPYSSGQLASASHAFPVGVYSISAVVKIGVGGQESQPSNPLLVRMFKLGDINGDNKVDFGDINPFILALTSGETAYYQKYPDGYYYTADINQDGQVNFGDINPFVRLLTGG